jgi:hypothetical protein
MYIEVLALAVHVACAMRGEGKGARMACGKNQWLRQEISEKT